MSEISGIEGLRGRPPIGVKLSIGYRGPGQRNPTEKDRFHLLLPRERDGRCEDHPSFSGPKGFNIHDTFKDNPQDPRKKIRVKPNEQALARRRIIKGNLIHAYIDEAFFNRLSCYKLPDMENPPNRMPGCRGDGRVAIRWVDGEFKEIECPHNLCKYREEGRWKDKKGNVYIPCKPMTRLIFRLRWSDDSPFPSMLCSYTSGSWYTAQNIQGFFDHVKETAQHLGIEDPFVFSLPFILTLYERTGKGHRWPEVSMAMDGEDMLTFLGRTKQLLQQLGTDYVKRPMLETSDGSEAVLRREAEDLQMVVPSA